MSGPPSEPRPKKRSSSRRRASRSKPRSSRPRDFGVRVIGHYLDGTPIYGKPDDLFLPDEDREREPIEKLAIQTMQFADARSKKHESYARMYAFWNFFLGLPAAILAAISGIAAFAENTTLAGIAAFVVAGLTATITFLNPAEKAKVHGQAQREYNQIATRIQNRLPRWDDPDLSKEERAWLDKEVAGLAEQRAQLVGSSPDEPAFLIPDQFLFWQRKSRVDEDDEEPVGSRGVRDKVFGSLAARGKVYGREPVGSGVARGKVYEEESPDPS